MRISKYLAGAGISARRKAEQLVKDGDVTVNGKTVTDLSYQIGEKDQVKVRGKLIIQEEKGLIIMHKPLGVLCTKSDEQGRPTIMEFVDKRYKSYFPVGRLDYNTTGLILLTNDGELGERLAHPRFGFERVYRVKVKGTVTAQTIIKITKGVKLEDGFIATKARLTKHEGELTSIEIKLKEGRNRIVRRLMEHFGLKVVTLKRIEFGPFKLGTLAIGATKLLPKKDYENLKQLVYKNSY